MAKKMAGGRRSSAVSAATTGPAAPAALTQVAAQIVVGDGVDIPSYYSNFIEVGHSQHEFVLNFVRTPSALSPSRMEAVREAGKIVVEPMLQVTIPPTLVPGLLKALQLQKDKYNSAFGKITGDTSEKDKPDPAKKGQSDGNNDRS